MAEHCPFLIERAVVAVLRAAMHLIQIGSGDKPEDKDLSASVWKSVGLIMEVPHSVLLLFAERLGAGLISLVRYVSLPSPPPPSLSLQCQPHLLLSVAPLVWRP
jgi:hypothetical protein